VVKDFSDSLAQQPMQLALAYTGDRVIKSPRGARRGAKIVSAYKRAITHVIKKIEDGKWLPGYRLPGAQDLGLELGISESVVNDAYRSLRENGWIEGRPGVGRFVLGIGRPVFVGDSNAEPLGNDAA
jgi:biotin operon repressor